MNVTESWSIHITKKKHQIQLNELPSPLTICLG